MSDEKATFMMRVANAQARADGKREPFPTPSNCPHCAYERQFPGFGSGGWIRQDNGGPIVSCPVCNDAGDHPRGD